jgi:hypothetical protein
VALCMHDELVPPWMGSNASTPPRIGHACGLCSKPTSSIQYSRRRKKSTAHESSSQFVVVRGALVIRRFDRENARGGDDDTSRSVAGNRGPISPRRGPTLSPFNSSPGAAQ